MDGAGFLCLQQDYPAGPGDDFASREFPRREGLDDRSLKIHCLMTRSPGERGDLYQRKGIGSRMVQRLHQWAVETKWTRIEVEAFEDLPLIYEVTGSAGRTFWEKLGFRVADRFPHPYLCEPSEFLTRLEDEAAAAGMDLAKARDCLIMRLDLA
jgi:GNAT superfamily N-acetyltransferase